MNRRISANLNEIPVARIGGWGISPGLFSGREKQCKVVKPPADRPSVRIIFVVLTKRLLKGWRVMGAESAEARKSVVDTSAVKEVLKAVIRYRVENTIVRASALKE